MWKIWLLRAAGQDGVGNGWTWQTCVLIMAAVTNGHKFSGFKQHKSITRQFWGQSSQMGLIELKSKCQQGWYFSGGSRAEQNSWPFPKAVHIPRHSSSIFKATMMDCVLHPPVHFDIVFYGQHSLCFTLLTPFSTFKETCDCIGPILIIQDNLSISKSLTSSAMSLFACKATYSQVLDTFWYICGRWG